MTNSEAVECLKNIEILSYRDRAERYFMGDVCEALDLAIKALEQQPCDWKFYYKHGYAQARNDVLDEIRAEIIELRSRQNVGVLECLDIIDKYKIESEDKE